MSDNNLEERMNEIATELIEHCDSIVILASVNDAQYDRCIYSYRGNYHTVVGLMEDFKIKKGVAHLEAPVEDDLK